MIEWKKYLNRRLTALQRVAVVVVAAVLGGLGYVTQESILGHPHTPVFQDPGAGEAMAGRVAV